jgi:hypothetical protein
MAPRHHHRAGDPAGAVHADVGALSRVPVSHATHPQARWPPGGGFPLGAVARGPPPAGAVVLLRQGALFPPHLHGAVTRGGGPLGPADGAPPGMAGPDRGGPGWGSGRPAQPWPGRGRQPSHAPARAPPATAPVRPWLTRATTSTLEARRRFATGRYADYEAVKAGVTLPWSTSPVEGHSNRLKMLQRPMCGRAHLDLLSRRFIRASACDQERSQPEAVAASSRVSNRVWRATTPDVLGAVAG